MELRELPPTISVEQAAQLLGIGRRAAYSAAASGELPTLRLGSRLRVPTARLLQMLGLETGDLAMVASTSDSAA